jgi:hypothetical protein
MEYPQLEVSLRIKRVILFLVCKYKESKTRTAHNDILRLMTLFEGKAQIDKSEDHSIPAFNRS